MSTEDKQPAGGAAVIHEAKRTPRPLDWQAAFLRRPLRRDRHPRTSPEPQRNDVADSQARRLRVDPWPAAHRALRLLTGLARHRGRHQRAPWTRAISAGSAVLVCACTGCATAPPPVATAPAAAPAPTETAQPAAPTYSKYTDPMFLALDEQRNVYGRRTLARLWVVDAELDAPSDAQQQRLALARASLAKIDEAVAAQTDPCAAHVTVAFDRAQATKQQLEQRFLALPDEQAQTDKARRLDAQIHLMRDEVEQLESLAAQCPKEMYESDEGGA